MSVPVHVLATLCVFGGAAPHFGHRSIITAQTACQSATARRSPRRFRHI